MATITVGELISMISREVCLIEIANINAVNDCIMTFHKEDVLKNENHMFDSVLNQKVIKFNYEKYSFVIYV